MRPATTPAQTVGPFFSLGLPWPDGPQVVPDDSPGAIAIAGRLLDGAGEPVADGLVETWQPDAGGRFDHPDDPRGRRSGFSGFGRCPTDEQGRWRIVTVKPGPVPAGDGELQAPHVAVTILARGLLNRVVTRIYFGDEQAANAADPLLAALADPQRATLLAARVAGGYELDFRLQGDGETVFLDI